jgi:hypothetical protein
MLTPPTIQRETGVGARQGAESTPIYRVTGLTVYSLPLVFVKTWLVIARGETSTLGWSNPRLVPDESGESEWASFSFEADEPGGAALQVISPIITSTIFQPAAELRGVRVRSATNEIVRSASLFRAGGSGEEEEGEHDFIPYESEFGDLGYEPEDASDLVRAIPLMMARTAGQQCDRKRLFKIVSRIEFKTRGFKLYRRERYLTTYLKFCYPTDIGDEAVEAIRRCLPVAIAAGVAGASGGPAGAAAAFVAAMKGCVGAELGSKVSVGIDTDEEKGDWHRV